MWDGLVLGQIKRPFDALANKEPVSHRVQYTCVYGPKIVYNLTKGAGDAF